jgi:ABC-type sugar transport system substrate-binding protein
LRPWACHDIIRTQTCPQNIADRVNGSKEAFAACGVTVVAELNGEHTRKGGQAVMEDIITANPNAKAVFCANDNMALGAVEALKAAGKLEDVIVVGFDANPDAAASILAGEMMAFIAQSPYNMGRFGVAYGPAAIQGNPVHELIDTGATLVTADNAADYTD